MEDLKCRYMVQPRVTTGRVVKKEFLECFFLGRSCCIVHKDRECSQTWVKLRSSLETLSKTDYNIVTFTLPGESKVPGHCTVTSNTGEDHGENRNVGEGKDIKSHHHLKVTCLQQTVIERSSRDTDWESCCHLTGTFCSEHSWGSSGELCKKEGGQKKIN